MLDRTRSVISDRLGTDPVDPNSFFQEGDMLHWDEAVGWTLSTDGTADVMRAIAGLNKSQNQMDGVVINEEISFAGGDTQNLSKGNLIAGSVRVTDPTGVTVYAVTTDYTINATNGQITRVGGGTIPAGGDVLVSFTYQKSLIEIEEEPGMPLDNQLDETLGSGQVVAIRGKNVIIVTDRYDTAQAYAGNDPLYDNGDGLLTTDASGGVVEVGKVKNGPTAADPWLTAVLDLT